MPSLAKFQLLRRCRSKTSHFAVTQSHGVKWNPSASPSCDDATTPSLSLHGRVRPNASQHVPKRRSELARLTLPFTKRRDAALLLIAQAFPSGSTHNAPSALDQTEKPDNASEPSRCHRPTGRCSLLSTCASRIICFIFPEDERAQPQVALAWPNDMEY